LERAAAVDLPQVFRIALETHFAHLYLQGMREELFEWSLLISSREANVSGLPSQIVASGFEQPTQARTAKAPAQLVGRRPLSERKRELLQSRPFAVFTAHLDS
jgi:hypothetical protein